MRFRTGGTAGIGQTNFVGQARHMHEPILVIRLASLQEERHCTVPSHVLFPQLAGIVNRYVEDRVLAQPPADKKDLFLAPYYGWLVEIEQALARGLAGIGR